MPASGNRYRFIDGQLLGGVGCLNVYYYLATGLAEPSADDLFDAWYAGVFPDLKAVQSASLTHVTGTCENLDDLTDFAIRLIAPPIAGDEGVAYEAAFMAYSFIYVRSSREVRNGWKRVAGVADGDVENGAIIPGLVSGMNTLAVSFGSNLIGASGSVYVPVIMRKTRDPITRITTYEDFGIQEVAFRGVTTQNTRKPGRGM